MCILRNTWHLPNEIESYVFGSTVFRQIVSICLLIGVRFFKCIKLEAAISFRRWGNIIRISMILLLTAYFPKYLSIPGVFANPGPSGV